MSPFTAIILAAAGLLVLGSLLLWNGPGVSAIARGFPRSQRAAWLMLGTAALWTLYHVTKLGPSDFGEYRVPIFVAFAAVAALSFKYAPDFLAVRGACALALLVAWVMLAATYGHYEALTLIFKALLYVVVLLALYLAVAPFRLRDFFQWLFARGARVRGLGGVLTVLGVVLVAAAFSVHA
jgi:hypothetical protein